MCRMFEDRVVLAAVSSLRCRIEDWARHCLAICAQCLAICAQHLATYFRATSIDKDPYK